RTGGRTVGWGERLGPGEEHAPVLLQWTGTQLALPSAASAGADVEAPPVVATDELAPDDLPLGEERALMGAAPLEGAQPIGGANHDQLGVAGIRGERAGP